MPADKGPPRRLGRGLDALLGQRLVSTAQRETSEDQTSRTGTSDTTDGVLQEIAVDEIRVNRYQPRQEFKPEELRELRESIKAVGLLQPVTVRRSPDGAGYELVAGERRLRAVRELGWTRVPTLVREYDDRTTLTLALVENLQREDLNPIEEGEGYARLVNEFGLTHTAIAELIGKDRSTVANLLRLLNLPTTVRHMLETGVLSVGHARPLLALDDPDVIVQVARETVDQGLSVRAVEQRIRKDVPQTPAGRPRKRGRPHKADSRPAGIQSLEDNLRMRLQTDVYINVTAEDRGEVSMKFYSYEDLNRLLEIMGILP